LESRLDIPNTVMKEYKLYTYAEFTDSEEAGIEDLFEEDFYLNLVNAVYAEALNRPLSRKHLGGHHRRIAAKVADYIQSALPDKEMNFDRMKPAEYFTVHSAELRDSLSSETLLRFEGLFKALNSALI